METPDETRPIEAATPSPEAFSHVLQRQPSNLLGWLKSLTPESRLNARILDQIVDLQNPQDLDRRVQAATRLASLANSLKDRSDFAKLFQYAIHELVAALDDESPNVRSAAYHALVQIGPFAIPFLVAAFRKKDLKSQSTVAE